MQLDKGFSIPTAFESSLDLNNQRDLYLNQHKGEVIKDDDTNVDSEKKLSLEQKLELKKFPQTKIRYRNQLYPKPSDEKSIYLKMRDVYVSTWKKVNRVLLTVPPRVDAKKRSVFDRCHCQMFDSNVASLHRPTPENSQVELQESGTEIIILEPSGCLQRLVFIINFVVKSVT
ncbi:hypothetical protein TNCV_2601521 [Trichonephila clavipes]|nr:hypothetical protein TNCV_2601521 [Trichonephila clavipes]